MTSQSIHSKHPRTSLMRSGRFHVFQDQKVLSDQGQIIRDLLLHGGFMLTVSNIPMIFKHNLKGNT